MSPRLYFEIGRRAFQRQAAYRSANLAGLATNAVFGYLRAVTFLALFQQREQIAGYDLASTITFLWVTQALLMVIALWGWLDVAETIRTGDVVSDLSKPFSYLGFWLARDAGRALYFALFRAAPILLVGALLFGLRWPTSPWSWLAFALSLALAVQISFAWRFMINLTAFWTADARGVLLVATAFSTFFSGIIVPLPYLPDGLRQVAEWLPFAGLLQVPADLFVERYRTADALAALARQAAWAVVLLGLSQAMVRVVTRRVVVQGG